LLPSFIEMRWVASLLAMCEGSKVHIRIFKLRIFCVGWGVQAGIRKINSTLLHIYVAENHLFVR